MKIQNSIFNNNIRNEKKNVRIQSCSFQKDLQILSHTVSEKTYIFVSIPKNTIRIQEFHFLDKICEIQKKTFKWKIVCLNEVYKFPSRHFGTGCIFYVLIFNIKKIRFFSPKYVRYEIRVVLQNRFLK